MNENLMQISGDEIKFDKNQKFFIDYYLNAQENKGNIRIVAGAGSGKTQTICEMARGIVSEQADSKICMITFTKKAAKELEERMNFKIGVEKVESNFTIGTIHKVIKDIKTGDKKEIDQEGLKSYSAELEQKYSLGSFSEPYSTLYDKISCLKNFGVSEGNMITYLSEAYLNYHFKFNPEHSEIIKKDLGYCEEEIRACFEKMKKSEDDHVDENSKKIIIEYIKWCLGKYFKDYNDNKSEKNIMDFDDMLTLDGVDDKELQNKFDYIFIDEFQDVNQLQYNLFKKFYGGKTKFIMIGDDDQSIYGFRGSDPSLFRKIEFDFKVNTPTLDGEDVQLGRNYRCNYKDTIDLARALIEKNKDRIEKEIISKSEKVGGYKILNCTNDDSDDFFDYDSDDFDDVNQYASIFDLQKMEAKKLYEMIKEDIEKERLHQYTVLYRSKFQVQAIIDFFIDKDIPFVIDLDEDEIMGIFHLLYFKNTWLSIFHMMKENQQKEDIESLIKNLALHIYLSNKEFEDFWGEFGKNFKDVNDILNQFFEWLTKEFKVKSSEVQEEKEQNQKERFSKLELVDIRAYIQVLQEFYSNKENPSSLNMMDLIDVMSKLPRYRNISNANSTDSNTAQSTGTDENRDENAFLHEIKSYFYNKTFEDAEKVYLARKAKYEKMKEDLKNYEKGEYDAINMMTIHKSKGLTFENVFIIGNMKGQFPSIYAIDDGILNQEGDENLDKKNLIIEIENAKKIGKPLSLLSEERRLMYVGLTRAKGKTYLLYAGEPSEFIEEFSQ